MLRFSSATYFTLALSAECRKSLISFYCRMDHFSSVQLLPNYASRPTPTASVFFFAEHRISNSVFRGNSHQAINYTSVATGSDARPRLVIERCKITDTAVLPDSSSGKGAISLEIQDNSFTLSNSFITGSRLGAVQAHLGRSDGTKVPKIFIYGNTFDSNTNGTIVVESRRGIKAGFSFVYIVENTFESNSGLNSTVKLSEMQTEIVKNFFHNNSGLHCIQYNFSTPWPKEQKCEFNTFFMNTGTGQNHGVTVLSNGPMQYRRNNFKNPSNLYEFSSTREPVFDVINAVENWWGFATESAVGLRLYEKEDDHKLARVEYKPFLKLPPRTILSSKFNLSRLDAYTRTSKSEHTGKQISNLKTDKQTTVRTTAG